MGLRTSLVVPVVKNLFANAQGHSLDPWSGKIPHTMEQLSPCTTAKSMRWESLWGCNYWSPPALEPRLPQQENPPQWEASAPQLKSSPHLLQLRKPVCSNEDPAPPPNKQTNKHEKWDSNQNNFEVLLWNPLLSSNDLDSVVSNWLCGHVGIFDIFHPVPQLRTSYRPSWSLHSVS